VTSQSGLPFGVLADDLTGALASAALLREAGLRTVVQWERRPPPATADALVVDMRTRDYGIDPRRRAAEWADFLRDQRCRTVELRIDSTLRGTPKAELTGVLAGHGESGCRVLAVPAFPSAGRTVRDGALHVPAAGIDGRPVAPLLFDDPDTVVGLPVQLVERGADAVVTAVRAAAAHRFLADATGEGHLRVLAEAAAHLERDRPLLTVSPGAWLRYRRPAAPHRFPLVVLSSATTTNAEQLAFLRQARRTVLARPGRAPDWPTVRREDAVLVIETISHPAADEAEAARLSGRAAGAAGELLAHGARHGSVPAGIVVGGGATGSALMDVLGARRLIAHGEIAPLCPHATVADGPWAGLPVFTKGGLVGGRQTLTQLVEALLMLRGSPSRPSDHG
jgi:uncharacterized protein YgbK (DUF1537 family)